MRIQIDKEAMINVFNEDKVAAIHKCARITLDELPDYPCRMDEMTERELQITEIVTRLCGAMTWIRDSTQCESHHSKKS